jgi:hypothetical protein
VRSATIKPRQEGRVADILAVIDFPSIKKFVFGTDRAREIRGGSALLDLINRDRMDEWLSAAFGDRYHRVFLAGGAGLFRVSDTSEGEVDRALAGIADKVATASEGGLRMEWSLAPLASGADGFRAATRRAHLLLGARKAIAPPRPRERVGILAECDSCSAPGVTSYWEDDPGQREWICPVCRCKRAHREKGRYWRDLVQALELPGRPESYRPDDFTQVAGLSRRPGYLGLVYMDGDAMGGVIKQITSEASYVRFSRAVDGGLRRAVAEALRAEIGDGCEKLPVDVLLLGGDDLVMVAPADRALPLALQIAEAFRRSTAEALADFEVEEARGGLTVSAGVALFKQRQPFRVVLDQAEGLLRAAKRRRAERRSREPFIDFADVSQTRFVDVEDDRRFGYGVGSDIELTCWPRSLVEAQTFHESAEEVAACVSKGRVAALGEIARRGRNASFETRRVVARCRTDEERRALVRFFEVNGMGSPPWAVDGRVRRTAVLDLAVLHPHCARKERGR